MNKKTKIFISIITLVIMLSPALLSAQSYVINAVENNGNPGGLNTEGDNTNTNWVSIIEGLQEENVWTDPQTIPFDFEFFGSEVIEFKCSLNGLITFSIDASDEIANNNVNLPSADLPENTLACFWDEFAIDGATYSTIYTKTFGTAPSRQFWVRYSSFEYSNYNYSYFSAVFEETTNKIYFIDHNYYAGGPGSATIGVQQNSSSAVQISSSPDYVFQGSGGYSDSNNDYFEFIPTGSTIDLSINPEPVNNAQDIAINSDLNWEFGAGVETYDLLLDTAYPPTNMVVNNATAETGFYDADILLNDTVYYWQIIGRNTSREELSGSIWNFKTEKESQILPFTEDFENDLSNWSVVNSVNGSVSASPGLPYSGEQSARFIASGGMVTSSLNVRLEASINPTLSFWYLIRNNTTNDITVDIKESGATSWTETIWNMPTTSDPNEYIFIEIDLTAYDTEDGPFRIRLNGRAFQQGYMIYEWVFIDDVEISSVTLFPPSELAVEEENGIFSWNEPTSNTPESYNVFLDGTFLESTTEMQYQFIGLTDGQTYIAGVQAVYANATSEIATVEFIYSPYFEPPSNLSVNEITGLFSWNAPAEQIPNSYDIYLDDVFLETITETEYQFTNLEYGNSYIAGISAVYDEGISTIFDYEFYYFPIIPPGNLIAEVQTYNDILLSWEFPTNGTRTLLGYKIYKDNIEILEISDTEIYTYIDNGVEPGDRTYYVTAIFENNESEPSNICNVNVVLPIPQNLSGYFVEPNILLTWDAVNSQRDLLSYSVFRDEELIASDINGTNYSDVNVENGTYSYNVVAVFDGDWESDFSNEVIVEVNVASNDDLIPIATKLLNSFPNPFNISDTKRNATTTISYTLTAQDAKNAKLQIYNLKGQLIKTFTSTQIGSEGQSSILWNGTDNFGKQMPAGIYLYQLQAGKYSKIKKMTLIK